MSLKAGVSLAAAACALLGLSGPAAAQLTDAYATDSSGRIVRSGTGLCWRTSAWSPDKAIAECDPDLVRKPEPRVAPAPAAAPAPAPAAAPAPAPAAAPAPAPVAVAVAPVAILDSDGDGVRDSADRCPGTIAGARVDANGCEIVTLKGVNFANNSAELNAEASAVLDQAAAGLARRGDIKVEVAGHTDNRGSAALNRDLSQRRAESVMRYLVSKGASASNLSARGYGPDSPVADNKTSSGRAENRRVELRQLQ